MKLSFANFPLEYYAETLADEVLMLQTIKDCGFTCIDYNIRADYLGDDYAERAVRLKKHLAELGMSAPQAHAPIVNPFDPEANAMMDYERSLEFCRIAEIPMVVVHAGIVKDNTREEYFDNNEAFYRSLIPAMERTGVEVLIENIGHAADGNYLLTGADLREMVDRLNHPLFGICWDTGHGNLTAANKKDLYGAIVTMGDKLHALHVHDNCGYFEPSYRHHRIDMHTIPFAFQYCDVNYDALLQGLKDIDYKGTFNFEVLTMTRSIRPAFRRDGEVVRTLEQPPLFLWKQANTLVYNIGKYMLETYGIFEE